MNCTIEEASRDLSATLNLLVYHDFPILKPAGD